MEILKEKFQFEPGDIIWVVERDEYGVAWNCGKYVFVAIVNRYVIASPVYYGESDFDIILEDQAAQTTIEGNAYLNVFSVCDCYKTKDEAKNALTKVD